MSVTFNFDSKLNKVTIERPGMAPATFDLSDHKALIEDQLKQLEHYRDDGRIPSKLLLDDIQAYRYILNKPERVEQYLSSKTLMRESGSMVLDLQPSQVAKRLGWKIDE